MTVYHHQIVRWLQPFAQRLKEMRFGYMIPVAIFVVISFPPLFGHEVVAVLVGYVWGLWIGFAIVAVGTLVSIFLQASAVCSR